MSAHTHGHGKSNRLIHEKSPYLLQHAYNPVDWYPWGSEALKKAQELDKPIFLSIGYSTCHWCHVMERESFVDNNVAHIMNENFINIKVDREERPDIDRLYMTFVTSITGSGGWPLSVFLTPTAEPLTGGTYFPPDDYGVGGLGFKSVLNLVSNQWKTNKSSVQEQGKALTNAIKKELQKKQGNAPSSNQMLQGTCSYLVDRYDEIFGGFGHGPKFPKPVDLEFLLYYHHKKPNPEVAEFTKDALEKTLDEINRGGIHDHLGKGFHRYAVDKQWRVPHFEKMLYDQGQLLSVYSNYYKEHGKFEEVVHDIADYVEMNLSHKKGGFFSAEDAESFSKHGDEKKKEGAFNVWTMDEIRKTLSETEFKVFTSYYNVREEGNCPFETDPRGQLKKQNVLFVGRKTIKELAESLNMNEEDFKEHLQKAKQILLNKQKERPRPGLDSKIITSWNGLMISGLCHAYSAFPDKKQYLEKAQKAALFIKTYLMNDNGELLRAVYSNDSKDEVVQVNKPIKAFADDYAFYIQSLLDLYEVDFNQDHLRSALIMQKQMDEKLFDKETHTGYFTNADDETVFARMQEDQDGVEPCANSVAALNLLRLSDLLGNKTYRAQTGEILNGHSDNLNKHPYSLPKMVLAANRYSSSSIQIVVVALSNDSAKPIMQKIMKKYIPDKTLIFLNQEDKESKFLLDKNENLKNLYETPLKDDKPTIYICENFTCSLPMNDITELEKRLEQM